MDGDLQIKLFNSRRVRLVPIVCLAALAANTISLAQAAASAPVVHISVNPITVKRGGNSMVTWSATGATSCKASDSWTGYWATSGSRMATDLLKTATFTLTCSGAGGSTAQSATVSV